MNPTPPDDELHNWASGLLDQGWSLELVVESAREHRGDDAANYVAAAFGGHDTGSDSGSDAGSDDDGLPPHANHAVQASEVNDDLCPICQEAQCDTKFIPCGHVAHWACGDDDNSLLRLDSCPLCRAQIRDFYNREDDWWVYAG